MAEYCSCTDRIHQGNIHHFGRAGRTEGHHCSLSSSQGWACWFLHPFRGPAGSSGDIVKLCCAVERRRGKPACCRLAEHQEWPLMAALCLVTLAVRQQQGWLQHSTPAAGEHFPSTLQGTAGSLQLRTQHSKGSGPQGVPLYWHWGDTGSGHLAKAKLSPILLFLGSSCTRWFPLPKGLMVWVRSALWLSTYSSDKDQIATTVISSCM